MLDPVLWGQRIFVLCFWGSLFCIFVVFYFVFCGNLHCSFAVNSILISVFKTLLSAKTFSSGFRIEVYLRHTSYALNR